MFLTILSPSFDLSARQLDSCRARPGPADRAIDGAGVRFNRATKTVRSSAVSSLPPFWLWQCSWFSWSPCVAAGPTRCRLRRLCRNGRVVAPSGRACRSVPRWWSQTVPSWPAVPARAGSPPGPDPAHGGRRRRARSARSHDHPAGGGGRNGGRPGCAFRIRDNSSHPPGW